MTSHASPTSDQQHNPFSKEELRHFEDEDAEAGSAIGKMLSLFFFYTVIVMTISSVATYWWITAANGQ